MKSILVILASSSWALAFRPVSHQQQFSRSLIVLGGSKSKKQQKKAGPQTVDWERAKHCAEHFGSCKVAEVEELYSSKSHLPFAD